MKIDVFHDVVCPWCRIGKKHLLLALEAWDGEVEVEYHTFFLNQNIPEGGADFHSYMMQKGGGRVRDIEEFFAAPREMGKKVGLNFEFEKITKAPNTLMAHRLVAMTPEGQQPAMIDALYAAYFEHGEDVGNIDVLVRVAEKLGMDSEDIRTRLKSDEVKQQVLDEAFMAQQLGITGVPMFVFDNHFALSVHSPPHVILQVMQQTKELIG